MNQETVQSHELMRRKAHLSELDGDSPYTIHGVAIGAGDVTRGSSGIEKYWPAEELQQAAESLQGKSLVVDHDNSSSGVVGEITKAGYKQGVGVLYEAELYDKELAEKINNDLLEVSIRGFHKAVEDMEETDDGAKIVEDIKFDNLSIVPTGAAPSNTVEVGAASELSADELVEYTNEFDSEELKDLSIGDYVRLTVTGKSVHGKITNISGQIATISIFYHNRRDGWVNTGVPETIPLGTLAHWDVSQDNIVQSVSNNSAEELSSFAVGDYVQWNDNYGIIFKLSNGTATVTVMKKMNGKWRAGGTLDTVDVSNLSSWNVDESNIGPPKTSNSADVKSPDDEVDELMGYDFHEVTYSGTTTDSWNSPAMKDYLSSDTMNWDGLSDAEKRSVSNNFLLSSSGFPAENFGDLKLPVVSPSGELSLPALRAVKGGHGVSQITNISDKMVSEVKSYVDKLASEEFDKNWSENSIEDDGSLKSNNLESVTVLSDNESIGDLIMTDIEEELEELENPVAMEQDSLEELQSKADKYEDISSDLSELRERTEVLDSVDRSQVEELAEMDNPKLIETSRYEELSDEAEQVKGVYAARVADELGAFTKEELTEKFSIEELREKYEDVVGSVEEELAPEPDPEPKSSDPTEEELEAASDEEEEEAELEDEEVQKRQEELREKILNN